MYVCCINMCIEICTCILVGKFRLYGWKIASVCWENSDCVVGGKIPTVWSENSDCVVGKFRLCGRWENTNCMVGKFGCRVFGDANWD